MYGIGDEDALGVAIRIGRIIEAYRFYYDDCTNEDMWEAFVESIAQDFDAAVVVYQCYTLSMGIRTQVGRVFRGDVDNMWAK